MLLENFNNFDYTILSVLVISTLFAFIKGFVKSIISILGWIVTLCIMFFSKPYIEPIVKKFISSKIGITLVTYSLVFILAILISSFFTGKLYRLTENIRGGFTDRLVGGIFGFLRGTFIACLSVISILALWTTFINDKDDDNKAPNFLAESQIYPYLDQINKSINTYLPSSLKSEISKVGSFKKNNQLIDIDSMIEKIVNKLSLDNNFQLDQHYINKLKDENTSKNEKYKILEMIYKINSNNSENTQTNEMIKELLDNEKKRNDQAEKMSNQLKYLIESD